MGFRHVVLVTALAISGPATAAAEGKGPGPTPAFRDGYDRGVSAGTEDRRRGDRFSYTDEQDYRHADSFYVQAPGRRDFYRDEFRRGFASGYREGYERTTYGWRESGNSYANRNDLARQRGFDDGYQAGMNDLRGRRRFDPTGEGRYRSGDHGYERWYGPKDVYRARYRDAFMDGYRRGFDDGRY